jgi:nitroimidazol reductase NimA-like FMN-containing flavoprotein (pyridoxamine 5'-phosphate oxidase superfamily)
VEAREKQSEIPEKVLDVLETSRIGYLSVKSEKGDLYAYPVAFYFAGMQVYFIDADEHGEAPVHEGQSGRLVPRR